MPDIKLVFILLAALGFAFSARAGTSKWNNFYNAQFQTKAEPSTRSDSKIRQDTAPLSGMQTTILRELSDIRRLSNPDPKVVYRVVSKKQVGDFYFDNNDRTTPEDSAITFVTSNGKRLKRFLQNQIFVSWFGAQGDGKTDDAPAIQRAFDWIKKGPGRRYEVVFDPLTYYVGSSVTLPDSTSQDEPWLYISGRGATLKTDKAIAIFKRTADYTKNYVSYVVNMALYGFKPIIQGFKFTGTGITGQKALELNAVYGAAIRDCFFENLDTAIVTRLSLKTKFENNFFNRNKSTAIKFAEGLWPGVKGSNCQNNANTIDNCRVHNGSGAYATFIIRGDQNEIKNSIIEGGKPRYAVRVEYTYGELQHYTTIENLWLETHGGSIRKGVDIYTEHFGLLSIKGLLKQAPDTLLDMSGMDFRHFNRTIFENCALNYLEAGTFNLKGRPNGDGELRFKGMESNMAVQILNPKNWVGNKVADNVYVEDFKGANQESRISVAKNFTINTEQSGSVLFGGNNKFGSIQISNLGRKIAFGIYNNDINKLDNKTYPFSISGNSGEWLRITTAGNVGINTTSPQEKLHVAGNILSTGAIKAASGSFSGPTGYAGNINASLTDNSFISKRYSDSVSASLRKELSTGTKGGQGTNRAETNTLHIVSDADYSITDRVGSVIYSRMTASRKLTLPNPSAFPNRIIHISNNTEGSYAVTYNLPVKRNDVSNSNTLPPRKSVSIQSDGTSWWYIRQPD